MARNFVVARPQEADASRMAEIHIAAMDANPLLHAQCPTPESLRSLQRFLEAYYAEQLRDPSSGVLIARDPGTGVISGFAKWNSPSHPEKVKLESGSPTAVEGCQREFLDRYVELAEKAKRRCFGDQPCYSMSWPFNVCVSLTTVWLSRAMRGSPTLRASCRNQDQGVLRSGPLRGGLFDPSDPYPAGFTRTPLTLWGHVQANGSVRQV